MKVCSLSAYANFSSLLPNITNRRQCVIKTDSRFWDNQIAGKISTSISLRKRNRFLFLFLHLMIISMLLCLSRNNEPGLSLCKTVIKFKLSLNYLAIAIFIIIRLFDAKLLMVPRSSHWIVVLLYWHKTQTVLHNTYRTLKEEN